ncbi:nuclear transport factor 2 family protein [Laceyella putida]|jgi:hypothetical protein|uniref:Nuclear transport factor 2 family protein n=1 Tax=Laceyella putida TaxID=110101 RepID=A0ABW2RPF1_9BACL
MRKGDEMHKAIIPVQQQLEAYNAKELERFLAAFAPSVQVYDHLNTLVLSGMDAFARHYAVLFAKYPAMKAELVSRMRVGNKVIDHERIVGRARRNRLKRLPFMKRRRGGLRKSG